MRATQLRWPLRLLSRGRAVDLVNLELKAALVNGGYAVVTVDVRGTGGLPAGTAGLLLERSQALHKYTMFSSDSLGACPCKCFLPCCHLHLALIWQTCGIFTQVHPLASGLPLGAPTSGRTLCRSSTSLCGSHGVTARHAAQLHGDAGLPALHELTIEYDTFCLYVKAINPRCVDQI